LTSVLLTLNEEKCHFFVTQVPLLGMLLRTDGYAPDPKRISNILEWERPVTKKRMQRFLGVINFFRRFVPGISNRIRPLLEAEGVAFEWTDEMEAAYCDVCNALLKDGPFLHFPVPGVKFELETDASETAIGAALF
jgi:RNase H-like domain found in reverse transcriptase